MEMMQKDTPTYPENGVVYEGDYLKDIPFADYIRQQPVPTENVYDIRDFGAIPDSGLLCTQAFKRAASAAAQTKGTVLVTGGAYMSGSIKLFSDTTLFIDYGSLLCASRDLSQFSDAFLAVKDAQHVKITGGGKLYGNGEYFVNLPKEKPLLTPLGYTKLPPELKDPLGYPEDTIRFAYRARIRYANDPWKTGNPTINRPMYTLWIRNCKNVTIENVIIEDALDWTLDIDFSENVLVKDIVINNNRHVANTDGIDVMSSRNVTVQHVFVSTADDGLCVKAPLKQGHDNLTVGESDMPMGPVKNVLFKDCTVCSVMNAFKIGTETYFDIEDVRLEDCTFIMPDIFPGGVSGISIETADGSNVRNVSVKNVKMSNIVCPIFVCRNRRNKFGFLNEEDKVKKEHGGTIEHVIIENVEAQNMEIPCLLTGFNDGSYTGRINDVCVKNFRGTYLDNEEKLEIKDRLYENLTDYPESNAFGDLPAYGFFVRHAQNVRLEDVEITPRSCNTRERIVFQDCI